MIIFLRYISLLGLVFGSFSPAVAEFYRVPLSSLVGEDVVTEQEKHFSMRGKDSFPHLRVKEEAYFAPAEKGSWAKVRLSDLVLFIESSDQSVKGFIDFWNGQENGWKEFPIEIPLQASLICREADFKAGKRRAYQRLMETKAIGRSWFRHQAQLTGKDRPFQSRARRGTWDSLSGGRAVSENLALDRDLILGTEKAGEKIPLSEIKGVTVKAIDWKDKLPKGEVSVSSLSLAVPEDQHIMIFPSLDEMFSLMERFEAEGTPMIQSFSVRNIYRELPSKYRQQLGLNLPDALARLLPVKKVAITGSDPFFPTGTELAILFESEHPEELLKLLEPALKNVPTSHLAQIGEVIVVANSSHQLEKLKLVAEKKIPALGASDEYQFFRHRYAMSDDESAYLFISDETLRRWAGPEIRIAASRRNRAMAALGKLTAQAISNEPLSEDYEKLLGKVSVKEGTVESEVMGSLKFITPIPSLNLKEVTRSEKNGYERWRQGYENTWAQFFDPIALRFSLSEKKDSLELTVLPLRKDSSYGELIELVGKARLSEEELKPVDDAIFQLSMAIDRESKLFRRGNKILTSFLPSLKVNPLSWMGDSVTILAEDSLVWQAMLEKFQDGYFEELPFLAKIESSSSLKLALFLGGVKVAIESAAPGLLSWEQRKFQSHPYIAITGKDLLGGGENLTLYYAATPKALLVSLSEETLRRALSREGQAGKRVSVNEQITFRGDLDFLRTLSEKKGENSWMKQRQKESWRSLAILNDWKKRFQSADPVNFHEQWYGISLYCPGGKGYRWNDVAQTMESVAFGFPAQPKNDGVDLKIFEKFDEVTTSADFDEGGLRLKMEMLPKPEEKVEIEPGVVIDFKSFLDSNHPGKKVFRVRRQQAGELTKMSMLGEIKVLSDIDGVMTYEIVQQEIIDGKEGPRFKRTSRFDDEGYAVLRIEGDNFKRDYPDGSLKVPQKVWPGLEFHYVSFGVSRQDAAEWDIVERGTTRVIGIEMIEGSDGQQVECLKTILDKEVLEQNSFYRERHIDWSSRDHGTVKWIYRNRWTEMSAVLEKVEPK